MILSRTRLVLKHKSLGGSALWCKNVKGDRRNGLDSRDGSEATEARSGRGVADVRLCLWVKSSEAVISATDLLLIATSLLPSQRGEGEGGGGRGGRGGWRNESNGGEDKRGRKKKEQVKRHFDDAELLGWLQRHSVTSATCCNLAGMFSPQHQDIQALFFFFFVAILLVTLNKDLMQNNSP